MRSAWTRSHLLREQGASGKSANSGVFWQMPIKLHGAGLWTQAPLVGVAPLWHTHGDSVSDNWAETCMWATCWRSFCRTLAMFLVFLLAQSIMWQCCCRVAALWRPSQPLLVYSPVSSMLWMLSWKTEMSCVNTHGGSKRWRWGVGGGHHLKNYGRDLIIYWAVQNASLKLWVLSGGERVKFLSFSVMPAINTALSLHSIRLICQNTHFSRVEPEGKSL